MAYHVPPLALSAFLPFIIAMNEAFEVRRMRRVKGKGKKPD
jgi:hypothetical protein